MRARRRQTLLIWLCLLVYLIGGTLRTQGLAVCIGEGSVRLTLAGSDGCACCAEEPAVGPAADADDDSTPPPAWIRSARTQDCCCIDFELGNGHDQQLPGGDGPKPIALAAVAALVPPAVAVPPTSALPARALHPSRAPPWSPQAPLHLRRCVVLLV